MKLEIPKHIVDNYNEIQFEIARITKQSFFYKLQPNGNYIPSRIVNRKYIIGTDWSPKEKKGSIVISYEDGITTVIETAIEINSQSKYDFDRIVNALSKEYESITIKEIL